MKVEEIEPGMLLNWNSEKWPNKTSRWVVLDEVESHSPDAKRFNIFCVYSSHAVGWNAGVNEALSYTFHNENVHRFTIHSQI